jgi:hypothetical protein
MAAIPKEEITWNLYIVFRDGKPMKAFTDRVEANLVIDMYTMDDRSAKYTIDEIPNDQIHFMPPIDTVATSNLGNKWKYGLIEGDKVGWTKVT